MNRALSFSIDFEHPVLFFAWQFQMRFHVLDAGATETTPLEEQGFETKLYREPKREAECANVTGCHTSKLFAQNGVLWRHLSTKTELDEYSILTEETNIIQIDGYFPAGFKIRGILVHGAVLCFQDLWLQWKVRSMEDITPESLCFLRLLRPLPDLIVLGCGQTIRPVPPKVATMLRELGIRVECIDSINATSTFNVLNQEGRSVVGALLPLSLDEEEEEET